MKKETFYLSCVLAGLFFGLGLVGSFDYQDQQKAAKAYCDGVRDNVHPDYQRKYDTLCVDK